MHNSPSPTALLSAFGQMMLAEAAASSVQNTRVFGTKTGTKLNFCLFVYKVPASVSVPSLNAAVFWLNPSDRGRTSLSHSN